MTASAAEVVVVIVWFLVVSVLMRLPFWTMTVFVKREKNAISRFGTSWAETTAALRAAFGR